MGLTALLQSEDSAATGSKQFQTGEYRGATSVARFNDSHAELAALRGGCGVYDLGYRAKISLTGADRVRWLNGMVTNNIRDLVAGRGVYAFLLNPQGRILADLYAYNRGDSIMVDTDRSQLETILATFDHYIIMDDVEVKDLSEGMTALGISGSKARSVLRDTGIAVAELQPLQVADVTCTCNCDCVQCTVVRSDVAMESYELWLAPAEVRKTWNALLASGASPVGYEELEMARIASGIPRYGVDIRERDLPQETEQMRALNFNKGCYVGQEIVERIRSRGAVHRKFAGFLLDGSVQIAAGTKISVSEKEVGEVTSAASLPFATGEKTIVLGYIRREFATPGHEVAIGSVKASVVSLPISEDLPQRQNELAHRSA